jgi:uncharacterized protein YdcH (DUF465 family)
MPPFTRVPENIKASPPSIRFAAATHIPLKDEEEFPLLLRFAATHTLFSRNQPTKHTKNQRRERFAPRSIFLDDDDYDDDSCLSATTVDPVLLLTFCTADTVAATITTVYSGVDDTLTKQTNNQSIKQHTVEDYKRRNNGESSCVFYIRTNIQTKRRKRTTMVEFGKQLQLLQQSAQDQAWKEYYIDYSLLKFLIKKAKKNNHNKKPTTASTTATTTTTKIKKEENENDISQKKRHKKSTSSLGNLLELMQSSSTTTDGAFFDMSEEDPLVDQHQHQQQHALNAFNASSSHKRTNSGSLIAVSPFMNASSSRKFQHMVQDGYVKALEFRQVLDQEIEKLVLFCLAQEGHLAQQLYQLSKQRLQLKDNVYQAILMTQQQQQQQQQQNDSTPPMVMIDADATIVTHRRLEESYHTLATLTTHYRNMASQLLQLLEFMDVNVVALRKILKKHDKNFPHFKLSATYLRERLTLLPTSPQEDDDNNIITMPVGHYHLQQIYHFGGLSSLLLALKTAFDDLHALEWNLLAVQHYQQSHQQQPPQQQSQQPHHQQPQQQQSTSTILLPPLTQNYGSIQPPMSMSMMMQQKDSPVRPHSKTPKFDNRKDSSEMSMLDMPPPPPPSPPPPPPPVSGRPPLQPHFHPHHPRRNSSSPTHTTTRTFTTPLRSLFKRPSQQQHRSNSSNTTAVPPPTFFLDGRITYAHEPLLDQLYAARNRLRETTQYAQHVAAQALVFFDDDDQNIIPDQQKTPASNFSATQKLSSFLNLASCALYMTNYYVVAPTVGEYALLLGSSESMAGIIIGMTPNAALVATVLYGWWSNHSYRNALIFAACSSVLGNILYALALHYHSLPMVLMGRFFNGFGSARSINRRYIADTFSKADRTAASADFVTSGALGMATGPAIGK